MSSKFVALDISLHLGQSTNLEGIVAKKAGRDWRNRNHKRTLGIHNWTQTGKGIYTRALCQKNVGSVKIKQRPIKMGGRTIYRTLSPKRKEHLFKLALTDDPTCERCLGKDESATHPM
jgi:hypothetical protein